MADMWYYLEDGQETGPVPRAELERLAEGGTVARTTPVWREGVPEPVPAGSIKWLFPPVAREIIAADNKLGPIPFDVDEPAGHPNGATRGRRRRPPEGEPARPDPAARPLTAGTVVLTLLTSGLLLLLVAVIAVIGYAAGPRMSNWFAGKSVATLTVGTPVVESRVYPGQVRAHTVKLEAGQEYLITVDSADFMPHVSVLDASGATRSSSYGGKMGGPQTYTPHATGTHRIVVRHDHNGHPGSYRLSVVRNPNRVLHTFNGRINGFGGDDYIVRLNAGTTYRIDMVTPAFDAYLELHEQSTGIPVATNDDGGEGLNSRIIYTPNRSGDFRIHARPLSRRGNGDYTVTVREVTPGLENR